MKKIISAAAAICITVQAAALGGGRCRVSISDNSGARELDVRSALCSDAERNHSEIWDDWNNSKALRDTMQFAIFEAGFDSPVKVRVSAACSFKTASIRPTSYNILPSYVDDKTIEFTIPSYRERKLSVEFDGDRQHNLFLIGHRPDSLKPSPDDPAVRYFGPGEHDAGEIVLKEGEQLYIDYGATVYGTVQVTGSNCTVAGHGVLSGERLVHRGDIYSCGPLLILANHFSKYGVLHNLTFRDITMIDSPSWNLTVFNSDNVLVDGINMISWSLNGDGIDLLSCTHAIIRNCFLRNYDDCITLKVRHTSTPMSDMAYTQVYDNLIFNDYARGIVVGIENGNTAIKGDGHIHDIEIRNCIILQNSRSENLDDLRGGIAIGQYCSPEYRFNKGSARNMENILIHDIIFDNLSPSGRCFSLLQYPDMKNPCLMENVVLENIYVYGGKAMHTPAGLVITNQHKVKGMTVRNFFVDGKKIKNRGLDFVVVGDAEIKFE